MPKSNRLNPKFIFIHIPRTAGTSCQFNIVRTFGRKNVLHVYDQETSDLYVADFVGVDATKYAAITGHIPLHQVAKNDQISKRLNRSNGFIFSVVRDPFEWAISLFNYLHSPKMSNLDRKFINFSKSIPENRQCQYLSCDKIDAFQLAARHPIAPFESFEERLQSILKKMNPKAQLETVHFDHNKDKVKASSMVSPNAISEGKFNIEKRTKLDAALHCYVLSRA